MKLSDIPQESFLRNFLNYLSLTEVPLSYQIAGGLSTIGALLRRSRYVDQVDWRVFPNQSILFIGPSGIGKDTIINRVQSSLEAVAAKSRLTVLQGVTYEYITAKLATLGKPAAAYIPAPEMTAFFGKADYQQNLLTGMTNLLSNGTKVDISTKGSMFTGAPSIIHEPTLTMHAGSTVEWLHKGMPEGTLEGGFLGRFLIVVEEIGRRFVPLVKRDLGREELRCAQEELRVWREGLEWLIEEGRTPRETLLTTEAEDLYTNWYYNRFRIFSRAVMPYANRSRDMVLRLAMLMACSRRSTRLISGEDMQFAIDLIGEVARKIDAVVLPPSLEAQVAGKILDLLPATIGEIYNTLGTRYSMKVIDPSLDLLLKQSRISRGGNGMIRKAVEREESE